MSHSLHITFLVAQPVSLKVSHPNTVEARFFEPLRETEISLKNQDFEKQRWHEITLHL